MLFLGGFGAWSIVYNAFISDTSDPKDRSMRYGILKLSETLGKPLGALLGNFILNKGTTLNNLPRILPNKWYMFCEKYIRYKALK